MAYDSLDGKLEPKEYLPAIIVIAFLLCGVSVYLSYPKKKEAHTPMPVKPVDQNFNIPEFAKSFIGSCKTAKYWEVSEVDPDYTQFDLDNYKVKLRIRDYKNKIDLGWKYFHLKVQTEKSGALRRFDSLVEVEEDFSFKGYDVY